MKFLTKKLFFLLIAVLPFTLFAQAPTIILNYMKVEPLSEGAYLESEKTWKIFNQKKIEAGLMAGWQLWRKAYAGEDGPYNYITIDWYENWAQTLMKLPEGFWEEATKDLPEDFYKETFNSRVMVNQEVYHQAVIAENGKGATYIILNHMKVNPGMDGEYMGMERELYKPIMEEAIRRDYRSHWGVWTSWPYEEGQIRYTAVDGFHSVDQMTGAGQEDLLPVVHPDRSWEEITTKINSLRTVASVELWELVDSFFPETEE